MHALAERPSAPEALPRLGGGLTSLTVSRIMNPRYGKYPSGQIGAAYAGFFSSR